MKKFVFLIPFLFASLWGYSQNGFSGVFLRVQDSATYVNSANTLAKHTAGYSDIWYSTVSGLHWKWNGTIYELLGSGSGGGGTVTSVSGTLNRIESTGGATPVINISANFEAILSKIAQRIDQNNASTTSAQLATTISDETGTGNLVYSNSPTLTTPALGTPTSVTLTNGTGLPISGVTNLQTSLDDKANEGYTHIIETGNRTLQLTDKDSKLILMRSVSAQTLTVPPFSSVPMPEGALIPFVQDSTATTTVAAGAGVLIESSSGLLTTSRDSPNVLEKKNGTNSWFLWNGQPSSVAPYQNWGTSLTPVGFSSVSVQKSFYQDDGQTVSGWVEIMGVSNSTTFQFSLPVPVSANYSAAGAMWICWGTSANATTFVRAFVSGGATLVSCDRGSSGNFLNDGLGKGIKLHFVYQK
jgi:hypothetical protein